MDGGGTAPVGGPAARSAPTVLGRLMTAATLGLSIGVLPVWFEASVPGTRSTVRGTQRDGSVWIIDVLPGGWVVLVLAVVATGVHRRQAHPERTPLLLASIGAAIALWCLLSWRHFESVIGDALTDAGVRPDIAVFEPGIGLLICATGGIVLFVLGLVGYETRPRVT